MQILYGQSLGGAVGIHLASQNPSKVRLQQFYVSVVSEAHARQDQSTHPRKHLHLPPKGRATCSPAPRSPVLPVSPEMGLCVQTPAHTSEYTDLDVEWCEG